ncbi:hypothetical protein GUITHDRAFT_162876 [Guillardia theta CCMP2712]|uniref:Uncharacterized protein n=1 Tax=Guillardia theta (strain CCMP2712) TaxID=905079 RepID=L1JFZ7_GUITC|nr:hypothetical protein GUITHDRAFT_162876 [Guillardia theta CCMP2712]EKX47020.1 hypothetical protein GUITHDRAFT_162876 [Guillardia theta CCMP2712]|eukprot:XP_005834000.1 hypothetical protein GUITHDRAFT_162876 [Guillardia theta CCMP2712]
MRAVNFICLAVLCLVTITLCAQLVGKKKLLAINTWPWKNATASAFKSLQAGGTSVDAVEAGCRKCEEMQCDGTVGFGGSPDSTGEVTLDAMIMDGASHDMGAVGCLRNIRNAISVARSVMEHTSHSLLVGEKATSYAVMAGFKEEPLETDRSNLLHAAWLASHCQPNFFRGFPGEDKECPPYHSPVRPNQTRSEQVSRHVSRRNHDTIGMIALDAEGNLAVGTSTNGASHKIAGRVGDAAVIGAGGYVDKDVGAAAATGCRRDGDVMMRFLPAHRAVMNMRLGLTPAEACQEALSSIARVYPSFQGALICVSAHGSV